MWSTQAAQFFPEIHPGIFNIAGSYEQDAKGTYSAEIGGPGAGTGYDQIKVNGMATLGGTLRVRLVKGFTPAVGQELQTPERNLEKRQLQNQRCRPVQAGLSLTTDASGVTAKVTSVVAGAPVINSPTTVTPPEFRSVIRSMRPTVQLVSARPICRRA